MVEVDNNNNSSSSNSINLSSCKVVHLRRVELSLLLSSEQARQHSHLQLSFHKEESPYRLRQLTQRLQIH